jgi:hypothetical protein
MLAALKMFGGNALAAAMRFFSQLTVWQAMCLGLALFALVQHFELAHTRREAANYKTQRDYYLSELQRITSAKDTQTKTSERTVTQVVQGQERVKTVVRTIHDAPNPPDCKTPGLSNLRNVL